MSTALIMFSVFFTGAVVTSKEPASSNTLMLFAFISLMSAAGMWAYGHFFAGA